MNTRNEPSQHHENISLLADGAATDAQVEAALAALANGQGRAEWALYHQIGDALRSDELAREMSADFLPNLFSRLEQEPAIIAPVAVNPHVAHAKPVNSSLARRLALPGMVAAGAAAFAIFGGSQLMVAQAPASSSATGATMLASAASTTFASSASSAEEARRSATGSGELLRDPDIDKYLLAHLRFSPSPYSKAQFARSPAFANDSDK
jgi:sigma-E factor negative regulatory protein RseA